MKCERPSCGNELSAAQEKRKQRFCSNACSRAGFRKRCNTTAALFPATKHIGKDNKPIEQATTATN